jgi:hypothetical protein
MSATAAVTVEPIERSRWGRLIGSPFGWKVEAVIQTRSPIPIEERAKGDRAGQAILLG